MAAARSAITVRYYLWADDGPRRLPVGLHQDLLARKVALPQYAGTRQKILEVFVRWITSDTYSLKGGGHRLSYGRSPARWRSGGAVRASDARHITGYDCLQNE